MFLDRLVGSLFSFPGNVRAPSSLICISTWSSGAFRGVKLVNIPPGGLERFSSRLSPVLGFHSKTIFESDLRRRHSKVVFEDDLQLSLILSSLLPSFTHFLNSFLLIPLSLSLSDMVMGPPFFLFCLCCLHHVVGAIDSFDFELSEWSFNAVWGLWVLLLGLFSSLGSSIFAGGGATPHNLINMPTTPT